MIGGVFLLAADPPTLAAWYYLHLGLELEDGGDGTTWFQALTYRAEAAPHSSRSAVFAIMTGDPGSPETGSIANLRVADIDAVIASLRSAGTTVSDELTGDDGEGVGKFARFTDPEGHRVELWQHLGPAPSEDAS